MGDLEPDSAARGERRSLADPLGAADVAINHYRLDPGERLAGVHAHAAQEEVFVVLEGRLTFETLDGEVAVPAGSAVRFAPGEHKSGKNDAGEPAAVLALGAPPDGGELLVPLSCPDCRHAELRPEFDGTDEALVCPACDRRTTPACPDCGAEDLLAVVRDGDPVSTCRDCGRAFGLDALDTGP